MSEDHNSDGPNEFSAVKLTGSQKKVAFALRHNAETMCKAAGVERIGFLTLTVGDNRHRRDGAKWRRHFVKVYDSAEASRRINNLNRRVLPLIFERAIIVSERHDDGGIHFHLLGVLRSHFGDIRTGFDFEAVKRGDYRSASLPLRELWAMLRRTLPAYGFGRAELTPVRKTGEAVASYVAKYIEKNVANRRDDDKGKRLVRYLGFDGAHLKPNSFSFASEGSRLWRLQARMLARILTLTEREQMPVHFGPRWSYRLTQLMPSLKLLCDAGMHGDGLALLREWLIRDAEADSRNYLRELIERGGGTAAAERDTLQAVMQGLLDQSANLV